MKIIFLDFDGVINDTFYVHKAVDEGRVILDAGLKHESDRFMLDPQRISILNDILAKTGANVVISSSWRNIYNLGELRKFLVDRGFNYPERIIDETPSTKPVLYNRGELIRMWLDNHPEVTKHVAIDDMPSAGKAGVKLIKTDSWLGLTQELANQVILELGKINE